MTGSAETRWPRIKELFAHAIELPPDSRAAWLSQACGGDAVLHGELEALVRAHFDAGGFLEQSVLEIPDVAKAVVDATQCEEDAVAAATSARFGDYRIVRELGRGGMGVVYLAARDDERFEKLVAVKVMAGGSLDPAGSERFLEERRILASLDHSGIARLLDAGTSDAGVPYVVMEYVEGEPIDAYCQARQLPVRERLALFTRVCDAVQYSHERLIVHRDIKARNILVTSEGAPKLLDFGIAKLLEPGARSHDATRGGFRVLTPESASPEQVRGETVTVSTDVYSLGVLLYHLLTGTSPYRGDLTTESSIVRAICEEDPRRPSAAAAVADQRDLRGDVDAIVLKALSKDPGRRYSSVQQFAEDVRRHLNKLPVLAAPDAWAYRARKFAARHRFGLGAAALVALSLLGGVVATAWQAYRAREAGARADRRFNDVRRLAHSFLFEFHDAIEPLPGSTKARQLVVQRATEYLDSLSKESANDPTLERELAVSYEKIGDVQGLPTFANLGDTEGAVRSHQRALVIRESLAARTPADSALQRELAATHEHLAELLQTKGELPAALVHARRALAVCQALYDRDAGSEAARRALAIAYNYMAAVTIAQNDWAAALDHKEHEALLFEAILAANPSNATAQRDASIAYKTLGGLLERRGDRATALVKYRQALTLDQRRVEADPIDSDTKLDLSFSLASIGYALSQEGDVEGSLAHYWPALKLRQEVAAADVNDKRAQETVSRAHLSIGRVLRRAGRGVEALGQLRQALDIAERLQAASPSNLDVAQRVANIYGALAGTASELAAAAKTRPAAAPFWHDARGWAQKALDVWGVVARKSPLVASGQAEVDGLRQLITKCDAELR